MHESQDYQHALDALGIVDGAMRLDTKRYSPEDCMNSAQRQLMFLGNSASKWLANQDQFIECLGRIEESCGRVHFLLLDPHGKAFSRLTGNRSERISPDPRLRCSLLTVGQAF